MSDTLWRAMLICRGPLSVYSLASHLSGWGDSGFHESGGVMWTNGLLWRSKGQEHLHSDQNKADFVLCGRCGKFFGVVPSGESSSLSYAVAKIWSSPGSSRHGPLPSSAPILFTITSCRSHFLPGGKEGAGAPPLPWLSGFGAGLCQENHSLLCQKYSSPPCQAFYTCSSFLSLLQCTHSYNPHLLSLQEIQKKKIWPAYNTLTVSNAAIGIFPVKFSHHFNQILRGREGNEIHSIYHLEFGETTWTLDDLRALQSWADG